MTRSTVVELVTMPADKLEELIARAVAKGLGERGVGAERDYVSAVRASKLVHVRQADVLAALNSGELKGKRRGNRWLVRAEAAQAWAKARRP